MANGAEHLAIESQSAALSAALAAWRSLLGSQFVLDHAATCSTYGNAGGGNNRRVLAVIRPADQDQLRQVLAIALQWRVPVYPVSTGKNWGYGIAAPATHDNVVLDLSRMNRILHVDSELAYAVVEPGVTQAQLASYLEQHRLPLCFDVTGSTPQASLLGNLLERGYGLSRYADHFMHSAGMEVMLADGRILRTGFGRFEPPGKAWHLHSWGLGPVLDGLFTQSNFGVVTKVGIWLMPRPQAFAALRIRFHSDQELVRCMAALRGLKLCAAMASAFHIANDLRLVSMFQVFPWQESSDADRLDQRTRLRLRRRWDVAAWNCVGGVAGTKGQVRASIRDIQIALRGKAKVEVLSDRMLTLLERFPWLRRVVPQRGLNIKLSVVNLMRGVPSAAALRGAYWRKPQLPEGDLDPGRDGCGLLWCSPIIPTTAEDVSRFLDITDRVCCALRFDTNVNLTLLNDRTCCCTVALVFDANRAEEKERAQQAHARLLSSYFEAGYMPYRAAADAAAAAPQLFPQDSTFMQMCSDIKRVVDPKGIIAPGRYGIT